MTQDEIAQIAAAVMKQLQGSQTAATTQADAAAQARVQALLNTPAGSLSANDKDFLRQQIKQAGY